MAQSKRGSFSTPKPFTKTNTIDNLFNTFYGFQSGLLLVQIVEARNIPSKASYCTATIEKQKDTLHFNQKESLQWNHECCFEVNPKAINLRVQFFKWKRKFGIGVSKLLCEYSCNVKELYQSQTREGWYKLEDVKGEKGERGEVFIRLTYTSLIDRNKDFITAKENYDQLMHILLDENLIISSLLCKLNESEEFSKMMIRLFNAEGHALRLLIQLAYRDLKATKAEESLFRYDSMATKTIRNYFKLIASDYLKEIVGPILHEISMNPKGYEVDPDRLGENEDLAENSDRLFKLAQQFLNCILNSVNLMPINMRKSLALVRMLTKQVFPKSELQAVGSLVFLRFINPAILTPQSFGLLEGMMENPEARRVSLLMTKVIQNLANGAHFKEDFMIKFDTFIDDNVESIRKFFDEVSTVPESGPPDSLKNSLTNEDKVKALSLVLGHLRKTIDLLDIELEKDPCVTNKDVLGHNLELIHNLYLIIKKPSRSKSKS